MADEVGQGDFAGKDSFIWWLGYIEDRMDPLKLGRVKVRCVGWDADNKMQLPTDSLPWAQVAFPLNNTNPYAPKEGDMVVGFFADGESAQQRIVFGAFPSIPLNPANSQEAYSDPREDSLVNAPRPPESKEYSTDGAGITLTEKAQADSYPINIDEPTTSRLARNETIEKTFIQERKDNKVTGVTTATGGTWNEPETKYDAKYPYNNVMETESGHIVEYDDTPGAERIHIAHRNGSFTEWYPDGDRVEKITKDKYSIVMKDDNVYIMGQCNITVQGNADVYVKGDTNLKVDGNLDMHVIGNVNETIGGSRTTTVTGSYTIDAASLKVTADPINLN